MEIFSPAFILVTLSLFTAMPSTADSRLPLKLSADVDGDGRDDLVFHDPVYRTWSAVNLEGERVLQVMDFGPLNAAPLLGRFTKMRKDTPGFYDPGEGTWGILTSPPDKAPLRTRVMKVDADGLPLVGNFTGGANDQLALFQPDERTWRIWDVDGTRIMELKDWGKPEFEFTAADVDGDGGDELVAYDPRQGDWHVVSPSDPSSAKTIPGAKTLATAIVRDFDGDGHADLGTWDHDGTLHALDYKTEKKISIPASFGDSYSLPVHADYEGAGKANLSYYSVGRGVWHLRTHEGVSTSPTTPQEYSNTSPQLSTEKQQ